MLLRNCSLTRGVGLFQRARYFLEIQNLLQLSLYSLSMLFATPFLFGMSFHWQWEAGAVVIFLAWFNAMVFLQRYGCKSVLKGHNLAQSIEFATVSNHLSGFILRLTFSDYNQCPTTGGLKAVECVVLYLERSNKYIFFQWKKGSAQLQV